MCDSSSYIEDKMLSDTNLCYEIKMGPRTFNNKVMCTRSSLKAKLCFNRYVLVFILFIQIGTLSGMPYHKVQISSTSNAEGRSPTSSSLSSYQQSSSVGDLLTSLFRQTIYNRIENLLLDPGRPSLVKRKIIDSAVRNYHNQQYSAPTPIIEEVDISSQHASQSSEFTPSGDEKTITIASEEEIEEVLEGDSVKSHDIDISTLAGKQIFRYNLAIITCFKIIQ